MYPLVGAHTVRCILWLGHTHSVPHTPRRLKGRLEVRRELPVYPQTSLYCWIVAAADTLYRNPALHPRALHCIAGRVERWATLAPPSFVIIARSARSASGVLHLEKSVISCSTAPLLSSSTASPLLHSSQLLSSSKASDFFARQQLLLNSSPCTRP